MSSLLSRCEHDGSTLRVWLSGTIDERADVQELFAQLPELPETKTVLVNLEGIERINSIGVHRWIPQFSRFTVEHKTVVEAIPYPMVLQANCVANLFGEAELRSCLAPYYCSQCNESRTILVPSADVQAAAWQPPARQCPTCDGALDFDELEGYFGFLRTGRL